MASVRKRSSNSGGGRAPKASKSVKDEGLDVTIDAAHVQMFTDHLQRVRVSFTYILLYFAFDPVRFADSRHTFNYRSPQECDHG